MVLKDYSIGIKSVLIILVFTCACKKKEPIPEPIEEIPPVQALAKNLTAKINGVGWTSCYDCMTSQKSGSGYYYFFGLNNPYSPNTAILLGFKNLTDTFIIGQSTGFAQYKNSTATYFTAKIGTIIVSQLDTTNTGAIKRLKASFNFKTDTINGTNYNVSEGSIDYEN